MMENVGTKLGVNIEVDACLILSQPWKKKLINFRRETAFSFM